MWFKINQLKFSLTFISSTIVYLHTKIFITYVDSVKGC